MVIYDTLTKKATDPLKAKFFQLLQPEFTPLLLRIFSEEHEKLLASLEVSDASEQLQTFFYDVLLVYSEQLSHARHFIGSDDGLLAVKVAKLSLQQTNPGNTQQATVRVAFSIIQEIGEAGPKYLVCDELIGLYKALSMVH